MKKFYPLTIKKIKKETEDAVVVEFDVPENLKEKFDFIQGQHLTLKQNINKEEVRRTYSLCSAPSEDKLRVAIKRIEGGKFSTYANQELKKGDTLEVMPAQGTFYTEIDPENEKNYLAFATGSGITPIMSIIRTILKEEPHSEFTLFYGNRSRKTIIFKEELEELKNIYMTRLSVHHILSREKSEAPLFEGRINTEKVHQLLNTFAPPELIDEVFICGVHDMIFNVKDALIDHNIDKENIHFELFTSPDGDISDNRSSKRQKKSLDIAADESKVTIKLDGREIVFPLSYEDDNILDTALKYGADLPYSCKGGVCSTCKAKLVEGEVEMEANYALEEDEVEKGYILCCQSHPITDTVKVDYDQV